MFSKVFIIYHQQCLGHNRVLTKQVTKTQRFTERIEEAIHKIRFLGYDFLHTSVCHGMVADVTWRCGWP